MHIKKNIYILLINLIVFRLHPGYAEFDVKHYTIDLKIDPQQEMITGYVTVNAQSLEEGLDWITLHFYDNMKVDSVTGDAAIYQHHHDELRLKLRHACQRDESFAVNIYYHGTPDARQSYIRPMIFDKLDGQQIICTESCPYFARSWWPCKDIPADKADSADIKINLPANFIVAANGMRVGIDEQPDGTRTHHWRVKYPIATYLITFTATEYVELSDFYTTSNNDTMPLMYFVTPSNRIPVKQQMKKIPRMIDILSQYYGQYPFLQEKYGMAEYITNWAAMEYQTLSCFNSDAISRERTILHELAHQWWGNCVTPRDFHHVWISEGLAVFSEALYIGQIRGEKYYHEYMNNLDLAFDEQDSLYRIDLSAPGEIYPFIVYHKGAWVMHMLRHIVGEDKFWSGLAEFRQRHEYATATTEDVQAAFEYVSEQPLDWFFQQWIYKSSYPTYRFGWWQEGNRTDGFTVSGFIDRIQHDFIMPVDLMMKLPDTVITKIVWVQDNSTHFQFHVPRAAHEVVLDENNWVLKKLAPVDTPIIEYQFHQANDSLGNNNGFVEAGEKITLAVTVQNYGKPTAELSLRLMTNDAAIRIIESLGTIGKLDHIQKGFVDFEFQVLADIETHIAEFKLQISDRRGYKTTGYFFVEIGKTISE